MYVVHFCEVVFDEQEFFLRGMFSRDPYSTFKFIVFEDKFMCWLWYIWCVDCEALQVVVGDKTECRVFEAFEHGDVVEVGSWNPCMV